MNIQTTGSGNGLAELIYPFKLFQIELCCFQNNHWIAALGAQKLRGRRRECFVSLHKRNTWDFLHTFKIPHNPTEHWELDGRSSSGGSVGSVQGSGLSRVQLSFTPGVQKLLSTSWTSFPPGVKGWRGHLKGEAVPKHWKLLWGLGGEQRVLFLQQLGGTSLHGGFWASAAHCALLGSPCAPSGIPPCPSRALAQPQGLCRIQSTAAAQPEAWRYQKRHKNRSPEWREFTESYFHDNFNNIPFAKWSWETRNA